MEVYSYLLVDIVAVYLFQTFVYVWILHYPYNLDGCGIYEKSYTYSPEVL